MFFDRPQILFNSRGGGEKTNKGKCIGQRTKTKSLIVLTILISVGLLSAMTAPSLCETEWVVGVNVGDWFLYEGTLVKYEADEGVPFPPNSFLNYLFVANESDWIKRTVANVSGTTITWETVTHWKNGSETSSTLSDDIANSYQNLAIGANMEVGDQVFASGSVYTATIIDNTTDIEYGNMTRDTNHAWRNWTDGSILLEFYWDKATGIQVKYVDNSSTVTAQGNAAWLFVSELVDSSVWVIPESHTWAIMLFVSTASTISIVLYRRRNLKKRIENNQYRERLIG